MFVFDFEFEFEKVSTVKAARGQTLPLQANNPLRLKRRSLFSLYYNLETASRPKATLFFKEGNEFRLRKKGGDNLVCGPVLLGRAFYGCYETVIFK